MSDVTKIIYEVSAGEFVHKYSLQGISWSITREMVPLYTEDNPRGFTRGKRCVAGYLIPNISIVLNQPIIGRIVIYIGDETITLDDVEILDEGSPCNRLMADTMVIWVAKEINSSKPLKPNVKIFGGQIEL